MIYLNHTLKGIKFQPFRFVLCCSIFTPDWRIQVRTFTINHQRSLGKYIPVTWIWDMDEMSKPFRYQFLRSKLLVRFYVSNPLGIFKWPLAGSRMNWLLRAYTLQNYNITLEPINQWSLDFRDSLLNFFFQGGFSSHALYQAGANLPFEFGCWC